LARPLTGTYKLVTPKFLKTETSPSIGYLSWVRKNCPNIKCPLKLNCCVPYQKTLTEKQIAPSAPNLCPDDAPGCSILGH
jgi:hypothetical protein